MLQYQPTAVHVLNFQACPATKTSVEASNLKKLICLNSFSQAEKKNPKMMFRKHQSSILMQCTQMKTDLKIHVAVKYVLPLLKPHSATYPDSNSPSLFSSV